jgi:hypothetical protein
MRVFDGGIGRCVPSQTSKLPTDNVDRQNVDIQITDRQNVDIQITDRQIVDIQNCRHKKCRLYTHNDMP